MRLHEHAAQPGRRRPRPCILVTRQGTEQPPLIFQHVLDDDGLRVLGHKGPVADASREGHPRSHEAGPIADDGAGARQQ